MSLTVEARVGEKYAVYLPKAIVEAIGINEGEKVLMKVVGNTVIMEVIHDPIKLAISGEKFASIKPESIEEISLEEQSIRTQGSS